MKKSVVILGLCALILSGYKIKSGEKDYAEFRPHMRAVYASLMTIFPLTLNKSSFMSKDNTKTIQDNLNLIAEHSTMINQLASKDEKGHAYMSFQLERNARQAARKYREGYGDQAHFFVEEVFDTCLSCHTSRSSASDSEFTMDFAKNVNMDALGTFGKAKFLSLSRQFDQAMDEYERIFTNESMSSEELLHFDPLVDYLVLAVRVKNENDRVIKTFSTLMKKPMPQMIKHDLEVWVEALNKVKKRNKKQSDLEYAKILIKEGKTVNEYPRDRSGLVYYIYASKYLKDHLKKDKVSTQDKAETYFQLGLCELAIGEPLLAAESGMYLEEAIRLAPKSSFARQAFGLYEEFLMYGYTGSSGTKLPAEEKAKLAELKKMVF